MSVAGGSLLVVDVGTSSVRTAIVRPDGEVTDSRRRVNLPSTPSPGLVEVDATLLASIVLELALESIESGGPVSGIGIANQRATTIVWDRLTGEPAAPAIGWQDLRTVGTCLAMQADGFRFPPNASATKLAAILDAVDPGRTRSGRLCFGTVDTWVAWTLSGGATSGAVHATDATNAGVTWMLNPDTLTWDERILEALQIPVEMLPEIVDSSGAIGRALALPGAPPICAIAGDQQASLIGQGCTDAGLAKATFGTGGMLDLCTGDKAPSSFDRLPGGTFPIVAWQRHGVPTWGTEAMMLSAGSCIEWLVEDLGILESVEDSETIASECASTEGLWFVPALLGLGTPTWDFGARGALLGATRGTGRPELVRAVIEGVAHRGADLLSAVESESGLDVGELRIDGGMSRNGVFVQALADATGRPVHVCAEREATTLGAAYLAGMVTGTWAGLDDIKAAYRPVSTVEPKLDPVAIEHNRERWLDVRRRAERTIPELSEIDL